MGRLSVARDPNGPSDAERAAVERLSQRVGGSITGQMVDGYFSVLQRAPLLGDHLSELGKFFRGAAARLAFDDRRREFVDMVLGTELICAPVFFEHLSPAVDAGVRPEAVKALLEGDRNALTEDECLETDFILAVVDGHLDDEAFRRVEAQLGASGAVEYAAFIGFLQMTIRLFQAFDIADPDAIVMAELLVKYARGAPWPPRSGRASTASGAGYAPA